MKRIHKVTLPSALAISIASTSPAMAQVAPTEVNEQAVDEFGLERKTGKFSWSGGEIVGIGGEGSRISVVVTGVRDPANAKELLAGDLPVNLSRPRLFTSTSPLSLPVDPLSLPGSTPPELQETLENLTVQYPGGAETFLCRISILPNNAGRSASCTPHYANGSALSGLDGNYTFLSKHGVSVVFDNVSVSVQLPDGRETIFEIDSQWSNNSGFAVGFSQTQQIAVNKAMSVCPTDSALNCQGGDLSRTSSIVTPSAGVEEITDSAGQKTTLTWASMSARERRTAIPPGTTYLPNQAPAPINYTVERKYPTSVVLPGDSSPSIEIEYAPYSANFDTHQDIRVSKIKLLGVEASYIYELSYPNGAPPTETMDGVLNPLPDGAGLGNEYTGFALRGRVHEQRLRQELEDNCSSGSSEPLCDGAGGSGGPGIPDPPPVETDGLPPRLNETGELNPGNTPYGNIHRLKTTAQIQGEAFYVSEALQPFNPLGTSRTRMLYVRDALQRETQPRYNYRDEIAGVVLPSGNGSFEEYDGRGNTIKNVVSEDPDNPDLPGLVTTFTYPPDCTGIPLARCNKPLTMTDPKGNTTSYEYNDRGQLTKEMGPAVSPGGARPTVVNQYVMRQAYIKNASGSPVAAGPPISMLLKSFTCPSVANCSASTPAADKVVTEYDYGPTTGLNNLLLRGMTVTAANESGQIETLRTCYQYNYFGERIAETQPKANLTSCQ